MKDTNEQQQKEIQNYKTETDKFRASLDGMLPINQRDRLMKHARMLAMKLDDLISSLPKTGIDFADLLARHNVIQRCAIDDWEDYDGGKTLDCVCSAHYEFTQKIKR